MLKGKVYGDDDWRGKQEEDYDLIILRFRKIIFGCCMTDSLKLEKLS